MIVLIVLAPEGRATRHVPGEKQAVGCCIGDTPCSTELHAKFSRQAKGVIPKDPSGWWELWTLPLCPPRLPSRNPGSQPLATP